MSTLSRVSEVAGGVRAVASGLSLLDPTVTSSVVSEFKRMSNKQTPEDGHRPEMKTETGETLGQLGRQDEIPVCRGMAQVLGVGLDNCRLAAAQQRARRLAVESQATLGTVLEPVSNGICVLESDGTVRVANKAFLELFGMAPLLVCRRRSCTRPPRSGRAR